MKTDFLEHLKDNEIFLNKDGLQSRNTICIGWLMGTHLKSINARDLEEIIKHFSFPDEDEQGHHQIECEVQSQAVHIHKGKTIDWKEATQASHIHVLLENNRKAAARILRIFSSANKVGFPLGHEYWFVPNTIDSQMPTPKKRLVNAEKMQERQRIFLSKIQIVPSYHICALDSGLEVHNNISLRQAIMAMKSTKFPDVNLFRSVNQKVYEGRVYFVVHEKFLAEANEVVPILARIMEIKYGPCIWN